MSTKRLAHFKVAAMEAPLVEMPGESIYAIRAPKMYDGKDRPARFVDNEFGLVVHTCGAGLPERAHKAGIYPTIIAADWYFKQHGPHYVCGWRGVEGDLLQVANERERANGVGTVGNAKKKQKGQKESEQGKYKGSWEKDLPASLVKRWKERWPGYKSPLSLIPGKSPNSACIQVEMIPCEYWVNKKKTYGAEPMRTGLKFTEAQHDAIAFLACDIARRKGWPEGWHRSPRLLGHADVTPISRHDSNGEWDPGGLRAKPYFDWEYVYSIIEDLID